MTERCEHNNESARCCECLTAKFAQWEAAAKARREERLAVLYGINTYHSKAPRGARETGHGDDN